MADLSGKVAIITGAASGIGAAGVEVFVEAGAQVVAADLQDDKGAALVQRFGADKVAYQHCDVTDMKSLEALMQSAVDHFGGLDILWNNAGRYRHLTGTGRRRECNYRHQYHAYCC